MRAAAAPEPDTPALPPLFRHHIRRPRLTRLLDASTARIILFVAPAGYGKTTLAAEWLQGRPDEEVAWYYASPASADVAALSVGIAEAVSHILPAGDLVRQRLRVPQVPENHAEILAELLARDLMEWPENAWLVLDDYHHAHDSKSAERFVEELVRQSPVRLLITTRRRPTWITARRVVYGEVTELTREHLSMTAMETAKALGTPLEHHECVGSETWPVLVGLAAVSSASETRAEELEDKVYRYLAEEILSQARPDAQAPLILAAIPPYLTEDIFELLSGNATAVTLSELEEQGLLSRDAAGRRRFHPLLREFLLRRAFLDHRLEARRVARRVASVLIEAEEWDAAFQVAVDSALTDLAAEIVSQSGPELLRDGRLDTLDAWLRVVGSAAADVDSLLLRSEIALRKGAFSRAIGLARHALERLESDDPRRPRAWNLLGRALHMRCDHEGALRAYEAACETASATDDLRDAAWGRLIATIELGSDDATTCLKDYAQLASLNPDHRLPLGCGRLMSAERTGRRLPLKEYREGLALIEDATDPMAISHTYASGIFVNARRGAYAESLEIAESGVAYCAALHLQFPLAYCLAYRAQAEIGARRLQAARLTLAELEANMHRIEDAHLALVYEALRLKLGVAAGRLSPTLANASSYFAETDVPHWPLAELIALEALVLAALGREAEAREREERITTFRRGPTTEMSLALTDIIIHLAHSSEAEAVASRLTKVLRKIVQQQCMESFVTAYRAAPQLLHISIGDASIKRLVSSQIRASQDMRLADGTWYVPERSATTLTARESEVAELVAAGLTNAEIATELFVAVSTAKLHVHRVMKKLHARTRLEAALSWQAAHSDRTVRLPRLEGEAKASNTGHRE